MSLESFHSAGYLLLGLSLLLALLSYTVPLSVSAIALWALSTCLFVPATILLTLEARPSH